MLVLRKLRKLDTLVQSFPVCTLLTADQYEVLITTFPNISKHTIVLHPCSSFLLGLCVHINTQLFVGDLALGLISFLHNPMTHFNPVEQHFIDLQWHSASVPRVIRQPSGRKSKENQYSERLGQEILEPVCDSSICAHHALMHPYDYHLHTTFHE